MSYAVGLAFELQGPAVVDHAAGHGRCHLVVAEDRAPPRGPGAGRESDRLRLVGLRDHLEEQPRAVDAGRQEARPVHGQKIGPADLGELAAGPCVVAGTPGPRHQRRRGEETGGTGVLAAKGARGLCHMGPASTDAPHRHQVLVVAQKGEGDEVVPVEPPGPACLVPSVAVEGLGLGRRTPSQEVRAPGGVPALALRLEVAREALDLARRALAGPPLRRCLGERASPAGGDNPFRHGI